MKDYEIQSGQQCSQWIDESNVSHAPSVTHLATFLSQNFQM